MSGRMASDAPATSWHEVFSTAPVPALALVCAGVWLHAADGLLVATMIPAIVAELGGQRLLPWSIILYELGSIVAGAASALSALRFGLVRCMGAGATVYATGCATSALAPDMPVLLAGRLAQGVGGGGLMALSFVAIPLMFDSRLQARVMALVSTAWMLSALSGPLIGGLFVASSGGWRAGFWCFALQSGCMVGWLMLRPPGPDAIAPARQQGGGLSIGRLVLLAAGILCVGVAGTGTPDPLRAASWGVAGVSLLTLFLRADARSGTGRLLPRRPLFPGSEAGPAMLLVLCFAASTIGMSLYGTLLITELHGISELAVGGVLALEAVAWTGTAALVSGRPPRTDGRYILTGLSIVALSILGLAWSVPGGPAGAIVACAVLQGIGFGMAWTFVLRRATAASDPDEAARIAGAIPTVQRVGYALGAAWLGVVANAAGPLPSSDLETLQRIARTLFAACVPFASCGWLAAAVLVSRGRPARPRGSGAWSTGSGSKRGVGG